MPKDTKASSSSRRSGAGGKSTGRSAISDVVAREYTIHLHKRVC